MTDTTYADDTPDPAFFADIGAASIRYDGNYLCRGHRWPDKPPVADARRHATPGTIPTRKATQK